MNSDLRLDHKITGSNKHGKSAKDIRFTDLVKILNMAETASGSKVQSKTTHATGPQHSNKAYGSDLQEMLDKR